MFSKLYEKLKNFILNNYKNIIIFLLILIFCFGEVPYVIYAPGGIVPLEDRIIIDDENDYDGSLNMSYVTMLKGKIPLVITSFFIKDWDLIKDEKITFENENVDDLIKLEKLYMTSSIDNAIILAYKKSNNKIEIKKNVNNVIYIDKRAKTDIKKYDEVISAEGEKINDIFELKKIINNKKEGDYLHILVKRNGKEILTKSKIFKTDDDLKIGIAFLTTYDYKTTPKIEVTRKNKESGSSGGLMLSLAIYNKLVDEDITKGKKIVGTGTIDINGNVGEIDGVKYKILGAKRKHADVFLCPMENEKEALKVKKKYNIKMKVKGVKTFDEALEYLSQI